MVLVELKVVVDVLRSTIEYRRARISPSPKTGNQGLLQPLNHKMTHPLTHLPLSMLLLSVYNLKTQQLLWPVKIVEQQLLHYGEGTKVDILYAMLVVRKYVGPCLWRC